MAIHHKLCHTLGGTFNLPHAQAHAVVLPHAAHYNREAAASALARVARHWAEARRKRRAAAVRSQQTPWRAGLAG
ncbi:iron-containing alcohol dehydrogenase [Pseudomonas aeruginosa]|nr:iron-containing alcohol dehydrogenase [Pseudomonas aeruginosa]